MYRDAESDCIYKSFGKKGSSIESLTWELVSVRDVFVFNHTLPRLGVPDAWRRVDVVAYGRSVTIVILGLGEISTHSNLTEHVRGVALDALGQELVRGGHVDRGTNLVSCAEPSSK